MNARTAAVLGAITNSLAIVLIGLSIGWLSGLSSGSVFSVAMPVLLTLIASALAAARLMNKPAVDALQALSIYTVMIFVIGLAGGASLGTMARLGDWFAPDPARVIARWDRWTEILPHDDVVRRVYERTLTDPYRVSRVPPGEGPEVVQDGGAACRAVIPQADTLDLEDLKAALRARDVAWAAAVAPIQDVETLRAVANHLCAWQASLHR
jgi:hypothetical protein